MSRSSSSTSRHAAVSNTVMDLLNWFWFYGISVNLLRPYLWFCFFLLIRTLYYYLSLCCLLASVVLLIASVGRFQRCLNLLAAWIELRFLIRSHSSLYASFAGWNAIIMRIFDLSCLCLCEWMYVFIVLSFQYINKNETAKRDVSMNTGTYTTHHLSDKEQEKAGFHVQHINLHVGMWDRWP